jgi:hypothetical protein
VRKIKTKFIRLVEGNTMFRGYLALAFVAAFIALLFGFVDVMEWADRNCPFTLGCVIVIGFSWIAAFILGEITSSC